jgi:glycosyltransferase involved in cell wall biosynthesis
MNGLFIGPYRQNDGWGASARDYIKSILTQMPNLTARPYYYVNQNENVELDPVVKMCEDASFDKYDVVYQELLPQSMAITKSVKKNVGIFNMEITDIGSSVSQSILNNMDEILVPSKQEAKSIKVSGIKTKCRVISGALDIPFIKQNLDHKLELNPRISKSFVFYFIGEFVERKNLEDVITAYNLAFRNNENVSLVIKTSVPGRSSGEAAQVVREAIAGHKKRMNIGKTRSEYVVTERLSDQDMIGLHNVCDCFVMPSYGEAFCRPAAEALILGKTPIVTANTGMTDFVNKDNGFIISSQKYPVVTSQRTLSQDFDIYNANSYWYRPNVYVMIDHMQKVFEMYKKERPAYEIKQGLGRDCMDQFTYEAIGKKICN